MDDLLKQTKNEISIEWLSGLQITVSHRTMANQNLWKSDGIATLVGHSVPPIFCCNIWIYHLQITFDFLIRYSFESTFVFMSNQIFLLSDQNGALVGHMSFQGKQNYLQPCNLILRQTCKTFGINSYKKTPCFMQCVKQYAELMWKLLYRIDLVTFNVGEKKLKL